MVWKDDYSRKVKRKRWNLPPGMDETKVEHPMQWDASENAGFSPSGIQPWLPVSLETMDDVNVATQISKNDSLWHYYRDLLKLRKETPALVEGDYLPLNLTGNILGYIRQTESQKVLVLLNFDSEKIITRSSDPLGIAKRLYSSDPNGIEQQSGEGIALQPFEVWIGEITKNQ